MLVSGDFALVLISDLAIAGTFRTDSGTILPSGRNVSHLPEQKRAAFPGRLFQDPMTGTAASMNNEESMAPASRLGRSRCSRPESEWRPAGVWAPSGRVRLLPPGQKTTSEYRSG